VYNLVISDLGSLAWQLFSNSELPRFCHEIRGNFVHFCAIDRKNKACKLLIYRLLFIFDDFLGGEGGIRTLGTVSRTSV
jgi:hypothetical protein